MPNLIIPTYGTDFLDENGKVTRVWLRYFQTLYDRTGDWDASLIEQQFGASSAATAELAKITPDDSSLITVISEMEKRLSDLSLQLSATVSAGVELQKRFDDLQIQFDAISPVSTDNVVRDLEIRIESIPDATASVAELRKSALTKLSKLSDLAATTSAQFATVISDETGIGLVVFNTSPTLVTPSLGVASATSMLVNGAFGCNGKTIQTAFSVGGAATDLPTVITLANNLRNMAINNGIAS